MYRGKMLLFSATTLLLTSVWIVQMAWLREADVEKYKRLKQKRELASSNAQVHTDQHRKGIQKDLWLSQTDGERLHYQIASDHSVLTLTPVNNHFEVVESLKGIQCWIQDKLETDQDGKNPTQDIRLIEATEGTYSHKSLEFVANDVHLSSYHLDGHHLPKVPLSKDEAYMKGVAHDVSMFFGSKYPKFEANQFKAVVTKEETAP